MSVAEFGPDTTDQTGACMLNKKFIWLLGVVIMSSVLPVVAESMPRPLGVFADHADVGAPALAGNATYNAASQEYVFTAAGTNMWGNSDQFHFAWKKIQGDFIVQARVEFIGTGEAHRKAD